MTCMIVYKCPFSHLFSMLMIDGLLGFNARAAIFQLYSGDEHKMDNKMNMK